MYTMMAETGGSGSTRTTVICDKKQWHWQEAEPNVSQSLSSSTRPLRHCCRFTSARGRQRYPSHSWISFMLFFISFVTMTQAQSPSPSPIPVPPPPVSTSNPTNRPSPAPVAPPPTSRPSQAPVTPRPSPLPSLSPTTLRPSVSPTLRPSTSRPSRAPTQRPSTAQPTRSPTSSPSTANPTSLPTAAPSTSRPTLAPTTANPSMAPSLEPSVSQFPSLVPSEPPTLHPTTETDSPTITYSPTFRPTTTMPSDTPSMVPSLVPTISPSTKPSSTPSQSPTLPEQQYEINCLMTMSVMSNTMDAGARIDWERSTPSHIQRIMEKLSVEEPLLQLNVITDISSQILVIPSDARGNANQRGRSRDLQQAGDDAGGDDTPAGPALFPLQVDFLTRVTFRSTSSDHDIVAMIGEAFNSDEERGQYISRLKQLNGSFDNLVAVQIEVDGKIPEEQPSSVVRDDDGGGSSTTFIVAIAAAGAAVAFLALGLLVWKRMGTNGNDYHSNAMGQYGGQEATTMVSSDPSGKVGYSAEIMVERQDDVSTLGDPVFGMMTTVAEKDEATASVGNDYDYSKQYLKAQGVASITGDSNRERVASLDSQSKYSTSTRTANLVAPPSVFSDDASFEQQFGANVSASDIRLEVTVPPGKLGMVIDTPQGSVPIVHAIKPNSVLADKVQVNDRLVSVDGEDVTHMTAVQVSKLISLKADQTRIMVFVRPRSRLDSR